MALTATLCALALGCGRVDEAPASDNEHDAGPAAAGSGVSGGGAATMEADSGSGGMATNTANGGAASTEPPKDALIQDYETLTLEILGGYGPEPCSNDHNRYTITKTPARVSWVGCDYDKSPTVPIMGERALSDSEAEAVTRALWKVRTGATDSCGSDASAVMLDVYQGARVDHYADDFYSGCPSGPLIGRVFVSGLGELGNLVWNFPKP